MRCYPCGWKSRKNCLLAREDLYQSGVKVGLACFTLKVDFTRLRTSVRTKEALFAKGGLRPHVTSPDVYQLEA